MSEGQVEIVDTAAAVKDVELSKESSTIESPEVKVQSSPSETSLIETNTSDQQIDDILKEVEVIRLNKENDIPYKVKIEESNQSTPNTTILSTQQHEDDGNSPVTIDSSLSQSPPPPPPHKTSEEQSKQVSLPIEKLDPNEISQPIEPSKPKANIPNSVSQALFSQPLKVNKIRSKSPTPKFIGLKKPDDPQANKRFENLQKNEDELTKKINKLNKEIDYLKKLVDTASVTADLNELRKLKYAIEKLEEYLDKKQKEKYEVGIQITRAVRRRVDSGESGEFWVN
ncbi:Mitochondrial division protein 1 [Wickerhamomyces ciferrii]|uniref:Mitochondrial division protein 1 n=1 Tax=Wickerhamomyces ciferrii (strain ATCC 14091 / BCRC 22168 / CBS 111 / JCM 3599 / NBRC 0793 / NRRL Y-1031 F-60-10) TaxID=1206466 RepID=K0KRZ6_WICCF|nr:Mitochondrial division protein 1 [Wickerhamomyces ciferrii]CCH45926.1 Mitochondrial division protein 1 [Wickerhamomyces ciferrii]